MEIIMNKLNQNINCWGWCSVTSSSAMFEGWGL